MSEKYISQSEDPLPHRAEHSYHYNKESKGTLGEVVVTDPRDPFVWLYSDTANIHSFPSANGKQLLWIVYRMNGHMPETDNDAKWRDERNDANALFENVSPTDLNCIRRYQAHLFAHLEAEDAIKVRAQSL